MELHLLLRKVVLLSVVSVVAVSSCIKQDVELSYVEELGGELKLKSDDCIVDFVVTQSMVKRLVSLSFKDRTITSITPIVREDYCCAFFVVFDTGWCLVSGDTRIQPILGFDMDAIVSSKEISTSPVLNTWVNSVLDEVIWVRNSDVTYNKYTSFWRHFTNKYYRKTPITKSIDEPVWALFLDETTWDYTTDMIPVPHLLSTKWGQGEFSTEIVNPAYGKWNYKCPRGHYEGVDSLIKCPTGCSAVAMSQIIYYMHNRPAHKPSGLYHSIECYGTCISGTNYSLYFSRGDYVPNSTRWDEMPLDHHGPYTEYVGDLMVDVGERIGMTYSGTGSGAFPSNEGLNYYSLACNTSAYNQNIVIANLNARRPVIIYAYDSYTSSIWPFVGSYSNGHTWVIDGYREVSYHYTNHYHLEYTMDISDAYMIYVDNEIETEFDEYYDGMEVDECFETDANFLLMNWGWDGKYDNGLYYLSNSDGWEAGGYDFRYQKTILYNIRAIN